MMEEKKAVYRKIAVACIIGFVVIGVAVLSYLFGPPIYYYYKGMNAFEAGQYEAAIVYFEKAEFKDSKHMVYLSHFENGKVYYNQKNFKEALNNFLLAEDAEEKDVWLEKTGTELLNDQQYDAAVVAFDAVSNMTDESIKWYAYAMKAFNYKDYGKAITYFENGSEVRDSSEKIIEAYYLRGKDSFSRGDYRSAKEDFEKSISYNDAEDQIKNCIFKLGENCWKKKEYENAKAYYVQLPADFAYGDISISDRLNAIQIYDSVKHLEGRYKVKKGSYSVRQIHMSTGIWQGWDSTGTGYGDFRVTVVINDDGSVTISGKAEGRRYTTYSSISSGLKEGSYYADFEKTIKSKGLSACTLFKDENITFKYEGGTTFTLSYNEVDTSQDVYFKYKYVSNYTFVK